MIRTVLGSVPAESIGITMCHEHIAIDLSKVRGETDSLFCDKNLITQELEKLYNQGCGTVVEATGNDMGRNVVALREYAIATNLNIIASTGFYLEPYHTQWLKNATIDDVAELFIYELTTGIDGTDITAGIIGEIATSTNTIHPTEKKVFLAAAKASCAIGCPITTHCDMATMGAEQLELLIGSGVSPNKIILGHIDLSDDTNYQLELLRSGANIAFDTIGKTKYLSDQKRADNLAALIENGYEDHILLSQDVSRLSYLTVNGGHGYTAVLGYFTKLLAERGISQAQIDKLLIDNPARILNW